MKVKTLFLAFFLLAPLFSARAEPPKLYLVGASGFLGREAVSDGKKKIYAGIFGYDLREEMKSDPRAVEYIEDQRRFAEYAIFTYIPSVALLATGIVLFGNNQPLWGLVSEVGALAGSFITVGFAVHSRASFYRALNHFNGVEEAKSRSQAEKDGFDVACHLVPTFQGASLMASLKF